MSLISFCNVDIIESNEIANYQALLPHFMVEEINRYHLEADRKARLLSRLMLLKYLRDEKKEHLINNWRRTANYKPYIPGWKFFNIAHSNEIAACSFSKSEIGLDIEQRVAICFSQITSQFCIEEENYILNSDDVAARFYEIWVKKEAVLKAAGLGIVHGLKEICCLQEQVLFQNKIWYFRKLDLSEGYTSFLCSAAIDVQPSVVQFKPAELMA